MAQAGRTQAGQSPSLAYGVEAVDSSVELRRLALANPVSKAGDPRVGFADPIAVGCLFC